MLEVDLVYTATTRCICGAGLARPKGSNKAWSCSDVLLSRLDQCTKHSKPYQMSSWIIQPETPVLTTRSRKSVCCEECQRNKSRRHLAHYEYMNRLIPVSC